MVKSQSLSTLEEDVKMIKNIEKLAYTESMDLRIEFEQINCLNPIFDFVKDRIFSEVEYDAEAVLDEAIDMTIKYFDSLDWVLVGNDSNGRFTKTFKGAEKEALIEYLPKRLSHFFKVAKEAEIVNYLQKNGYKVLNTQEIIEKFDLKITEADVKRYRGSLDATIDAMHKIDIVFEANGEAFILHVFERKGSLRAKEKAEHYLRSNLNNKIVNNRYTIAYPKWYEPLTDNWIAFHLDYILDHDRHYKVGLKPNGDMQWCCGYDADEDDVA